MAAAVLLVGASTAEAAPTAADPAPSQAAYPPDSTFAAKWTREQALNIMDLSNLNASPKQSSLSKRVTMPDIPANFPIMKDKQGKQVWVWDTWPLTDDRGNQYSYKGWDVIFSLTADPYAGYTFDDRHVHARIGYWFRKTANPTGRWIYGGNVLGQTTPPSKAEWSGSTRIFPDGSIKLFYTALDFSDRDRPQAVITMAPGQIQADAKGVWFNGLARRYPLLAPDGVMYQTVDQNPYFNFRDPFTFTDPANPGKTYMVFEGNTAGQRGAYQCQQSDLGNSGETPAQVTATGANYQMANIGLAVADNSDLTAWHFLPPLLSANCVNDQTERPEFVIKKVNGQWKYYLYTISHQFTFAAGLRGPDGVYGWVGNGIRSDFAPLNGSALAMGNPTNLNAAPLDTAAANPRQFQAYSHYIMPGGLVTSFIDNVDGRRGGTLAPTVKLNVSGTTTSVDRTVGKNGLLGYGYIPTNKAIGGPSSPPDLISPAQAATRVTAE